MASDFFCSMCETKNSLNNRIVALNEGCLVATEKDKYTVLISNWDTGVVDLKTEDCSFLNIRLRNCSLHYNNSTRSYFVMYEGIVFPIENVQFIEQTYSV